MKSYKPILMMAVLFAPAFFSCKVSNKYHNRKEDIEASKTVVDSFYYY